MELKMTKLLNGYFFRGVVSGIVPFRFWINTGVHLLLFSAGYLVCILLLNDFILDEIVLHTYSQTLVPLLTIRTILFLYHDLFQGMWRYVSLEDLTNIVRAAVIGSLLFYGLGTAWNVLAVPEALYLLELTSCVVLAGGIRYLVRVIREKYFSARPAAEVKRIFIVGPVDVTAPLLKEFVTDNARSYLPVALIDPGASDGANIVRVSDVPVLNFRRAVGRVSRFPGLHAIIIYWPDANQKQIDKIVEDLKIFQVPFKKLPPVGDILSDRVSISHIREVGIEDLLERPPVEIDMDDISRFLRGKTILVTGGGGSIGSEICRQVAGFNPKQLVVVERSENNLYDLQLEFRKKYNDVPFHGVISTINDAPGMETLMRNMGVEVVFHAAAYKHVPLMEDVPVESAYNNILGTFNVAQAAVAAGAERFVMISTDKAVNPTNIMGATKRIAEMIVQGLNPKSKTRFMTVRFGNVLGSAGSVIPIFKKQILDGGPVTVTHKNIERFFMTIPEAVQLVLQAGCMGRGGEIFVLDMGKAVKILKLAEKLITLSGKIPHEDIEIVFSGLRPGEKMYEELFNSGEEHIPTAHSRIRAAVSETVCSEKILADVEEIRAVISCKDENRLCKIFLELVPGFLNANSIPPVNGDMKIIRTTPLIRNNIPPIKATAFTLES
jgi:FlaA1/EpsC-like NDP-sugar epimerase